MSDHRAVAQLKQKFADSLIEVTEFRGETSVTVKKEQVVEICTFLKEELGYNFLTDLCGVDYLGKQETRFQVIYQLCSLSQKDRLRVKVPVEESDARIATVTGIWMTANWLERECWDLMGITFDGHPDPRRILLPEDWQGHPLRKDYPVQGPDREPYQGRLS